MGDPEYELASMPLTEHGEQSQVHAGTTDVIDVRINLAQRRPDASPARVDETKDWNTRIDSIGFVGRNVIPARAIILPIVVYHHADRMIASRKRLGQQGILYLLSADAVLTEFRGQNWQVLQA